VDASDYSTFRVQLEKSKYTSAKIGPVLEGAFLVAGTSIGAGMLGLPIRTGAGLAIAFMFDIAYHLHLLPVSQP